MRDNNSDTDASLSAGVVGEGSPAHNTDCWSIVVPHKTQKKAVAKGLVHDDNTPRTECCPVIFSTSRRLEIVTRCVNTTGEHSIAGYIDIRRFHERTACNGLPKLVVQSHPWHISGGSCRRRQCNEMYPSLSSPGIRG